MDVDEGDLDGNRFLAAKTIRACVREREYVCECGGDGEERTDDGERKKTSSRRS